LKKIKQGKSIVFMYFPDVLKFFNHLGVRQVNDVTAQVTAGVTAGMDPEGMGAHMGDGLQAPASDHNILLAAIREGQTDFQEMKKTVLDKIEKGLAKESEARELGLAKESDARNKAIEDECNARNKAIKGEGKERKKAIEGEGKERKKDIKGMKEEIKLNDKAKDEEINNLQKQIDLIKAQTGAASNKRPQQEAQDAPEHTRNIIWNKFNTLCMWKRTLKGVTKYTKYKFSSAEDALLAMERFYAAEDALLDMEPFYAATLPGGAAGGSASGAAGGSAGA